MIIARLKDEQGDRCPYYGHLSPYPLGDIHGFLATIMMRTSVKSCKAKIANWLQNNGCINTLFGVHALAIIYIYVYYISVGLIWYWIPCSISSTRYRQRGTRYDLTVPLGNVNMILLTIIDTVDWLVVGRRVDVLIHNDSSNMQTVFTNLSLGRANSTPIPNDIVCRTSFPWYVVRFTRE